MKDLFRNKKAQSTLEYVIIWTAIVVAILVAAKTAFQPAIELSIQSTSDKLVKDVEKLTAGGRF
ncbi:MAG: hypothetical protein V1662_01850 [Candidatus Omnitrophota bacterium]